MEANLVLKHPAYKVMIKLILIDDTGWWTLLKLVAPLLQLSDTFASNEAINCRHHFPPLPATNTGNWLCR